jgi:hypothetical protein
MDSEPPTALLGDLDWVEQNGDFFILNISEDPLYEDGLKSGELLL